MPRYVILFHQTPAAAARPAHWDFMLECGSALRTWALADEPRDGEPIAAEALPDHRAAYLGYEGDVSGGRGHVRRWDAGHFRWLDDAPGRVAVHLRGQRLCGKACLAITGGGAWEFRFMGPRSPRAGCGGGSPSA
jgi:hypothetical protein